MAATDIAPKINARTARRRYGRCLHWYSDALDHRFIPHYNVEILEAGQDPWRIDCTI